MIDLQYTSGILKVAEALLLVTGALFECVPCSIQETLSVAVFQLYRVSQALATIVPPTPTSFESSEEDTCESFPGASM